MYVSLIQNAALLVALSTLYSLVIRLRWDRGVWIRLLSGLLFGGVAVAGMLLPFQYEPGVFYDGRSIVLAMAGLFGGGTGSIVSILVAGAYRAYLGGSGVWAGLATIVACAMVGLAFRRAYANRPEKLGVRPLYGLGISAHVAMLASQLLVQPWPAGPAAIGRIWLPIMLIFPAATVLVGLLLGTEDRRVRGERALRQARDFAESLIQTANVIFVQLNDQGEIVRLNEAAEHITGYRLAEVQGKSWFEKLVPKDRFPHVWEMFEQTTLRGTVPRLFENPIITKSGQERHIVWQNSLLSDDGEIVGTISFGMDITERKQAEEALRASQQILEGIINAIPVRVFWKDENLVYLGCNAAFARDAGYVDPKDIIGKDDYQMGWREQADLYRGNDREVIESGRPKLLIEEPQTTPEGSVMTLLTSKIPLRDSQGEISGVLGTYLDISERKQVEEALQESERMLAALLANLPGMAYRCANDSDWTEFFVSEGCVELTGYAAADLEGSARTSFTDLIHPDDRQPLWAEIRRSLEERRPFRLPYRIKTATGEEKWVWDQGSGVFDAEDHLLFLEGFVMDISEKVLAEESLRERDDQLRQSQKMEAVGQLAGGIAHDFNNLLTAILGYSEMILSGGEAQGLPLRKDVEEIKRAAERAAALTRQILAFSRRQALQPTLVSLVTVLAGMEPLLRRTLGEDIDLVTLSHSDLGQTEVDVHQFEQVLMNLAVNARDAMPAGGQLTLETANVELGEEYCRTHAEAEPGSFVMLSVSDTGVGMDKETQNHIFEPFFTTKAPGAGTGLGLSTVYGIVRQSGGSIDVHSEPGGGTSFRIYLPRVIESVAAIQATVPNASSTRGQETILAVEDEESLRTLVARVLRGLGYTVLSAANAGEALEILEEREGPLDLLLTDVVLPGGMQGNDLARSLLSSRAQLPVIYMSGYTRDAIVHAGRLDEGVNYLQKPFTPEGLGRIVRAVLDKGQAAK